MSTSSDEQVLMAAALGFAGGDEKLAVALAACIARERRGEPVNARAAGRGAGVPESTFRAKLEEFRFSVVPKIAAALR